MGRAEGVLAGVSRVVPGGEEAGIWFRGTRRGYSGDREAAVVDEECTVGTRDGRRGQDHATAISGAVVAANGIGAQGILFWL